MIIRKATVQDEENIADIEWKSGYKWHKSKEDCVKLVKNEFREGYCDIYILENKVKKAGYFALSYKNKICYINYLAIKKEFQGKELSKKIMDRIIKLARKNKCNFIELTVWAKNFPAISLYTKYGFYVTSIKVKHYKNGDDKLRMRKDL